jgi:SAM-dependent methyltransferase/uncharacterized protein YbaR (Trm112 family)
MPCLGKWTNVSETDHSDSAGTRGVMRQHVENQKGEIEFRRKLYLQEVEREKVLDDEFDPSDIERILAERMKKTLDQMLLLKERGLPLSPYMEIGAERCQRTLVMENDLGLDGAAVDISFDLLRSCTHYQRVFNRPASPLRICCDANNLPFMTGSLPFVFCYETLHHFPEPGPILQEAHRVLRPGGWFFFDEEPYKRILHLNLYKGPKIYSKEFRTRSKVRRLLDRFFCEVSCNEVEHGVIENDNMSIGLWKRALALFDQRDITLQPTTRMKTALFNPRSRIHYIIACLLGGNISGLCRKSGNDTGAGRSIYDTLGCPSCRQSGSEAPLRNQGGASFACPRCSNTYPVVDGVAFLFAYDKLKELYPEVFESLRKG